MQLFLGAVPIILRLQIIPGIICQSLPTTMIIIVTPRTITLTHNNIIYYLNYSSTTQSCKQLYICSTSRMCSYKLNTGNGYSEGMLSHDSLEYWAGVLANHLVNTCWLHLTIQAFSTYFAFLLCSINLPILLYPFARFALSFTHFAFQKFPLHTVIKVQAQIRQSNEQGCIAT